MTATPLARSGWDAGGLARRKLSAIVLARALARLRPPDLGSEEANERLWVIHLLGAALFVGAAYGHLVPPPDAWYRYAETLALIGAVLLARRGHLGTASAALPTVVLLVLLDTAFRGYGLHDVTFLGFPIALAVSGLLLGGLGPLLFGALTLLAASLLYAAEATGRLRTPWSPELSPASLEAAWILLGINAVALSLMIWRLDRARRRSQRQAEALRESEARWRSLIVDAPLTLISIDRSAAIRFVNLAPAPAERLLAHDVYALFKGPYQNAAREAIRGALEDGAVTSFEAEMGTGAGDLWRYSIHVGPVRVEERIEGATLICIDVMERHRAREEREALIRELGERNAELESFTYTVSHDLRSPLVTMKGFLGAVVGAARAGDLELVESDVARIRGAADRMDRLLRELLELSRIGRLREERERLDLGALVREARELVSGRLEERRVAVEIEPTLPSVYGERRRIVQLLQNLLDNAAKFMGEQQHPLVRVGARRDGAALVFFVCDNGVGIEPEHRERVFGLFDRLESGNDGTGVGLAIAKRVVETHGGRIWVESRGRGSGSCFCFTLAEASEAPTG